MSQNRHPEPDKNGPKKVPPSVTIGPAGANAAPSLAATVSPLSQGNSLEASQSALTFDFLAPPDRPDELGRLGSYRVLKVLGHGGMGVVFQAEDVRLQRAVALKAMLPDWAKRAGARDRFLREARAAAQLEHDHIVAIYQVDEDRGVPFIAMPLLKGLTLEDWLRKRQPPDAPVKLAQILKIGREIARGLNAAHDRGLIHRDIKPANIWLDAAAGGRVKILDFGLARATSGDQNLTQSGVIIGTPAYMAPEQARSETTDPRADLFSLGVVLYRLATGQVPFKGHDVMSTLMSVALNEPVPPRTLNPDLPQGLAALIMSLLVKAPGQRLGPAAEIVRRLQLLEKENLPGEAAPQLTLAAGPAGAHLPTDAAPTCSETPPLQKSRSRRAVYVSIGCVLLTLLVAVLVVLPMMRGPGDALVETMDTAQQQSASSNSPPQAVRPPTDAPVPVEKPPAKAVAANTPEPSRIIPDPVAHLLAGHTADIRQVQILPDGKRGASVSWDGSVRIWDLASGKPLRALWPPRQQMLNCLAISPDGKLLAAGGTYNRMYLWDTDTFEHLGENQTTANAIAAVAFAADGKRLFANAARGEVWEFPVPIGPPLAKYRVLENGVAGIYPLADGKRILCCSWGQTDFVLWDRVKKTALQTFAGNPKFHTVALAPFHDGTRAASIDWNGVLRVWSLDTGKKLSQVHAHVGPAIRGTAVHVLHNDRWLLTTGEDKTICIWDAQTLTRLYQARADHLVTSQSAVSRDGRLLLTGAGWQLSSTTIRDNDFVLRLWRLPVP